MELGGDLKGGGGVDVESQRMGGRSFSPKGEGEDK